MKFLIVGLFIVVAAPAADSPTPPVTFNRDVLPILQKNCQECHRPNQIAPISFLTYQEARPWAKAIKGAVLTQKMPPWFADPRYGHFSNERRLSDAEIKTLVTWADGPAPEGDPKDRPAPIAFSQEGWTIKPDLIFAMPQPYNVPAEGAIEYIYYLVPGSFSKDTWVAAAEILPGNRRVVHHAAVFVRPPGSEWLKEAKPGEPFVPGRPQRDASGARIDRRNRRNIENEFLIGYVPGLAAQNFVVGDSAKLIPAGSDLVLQLHYTANGKAASDLTNFGLTLAKDPPRRRYLKESVMNLQLALPPNEPNYEVHSQVTFEQDVQLVWLQPHMHLRGKDFEYRLVVPSGQSETVLKVAHYNPYWQLGYELAKPMRLPKGTRMECIAHFDNSQNNALNPNPNVEVHWGDQSWDEMMVGLFGVIVDIGADPAKVVLGR